MRTAPYIFQLWERGGPFVGEDAAPHTRVTIEPGYWLTTDYSVAVTDPSKLPFRWFQRADNSQVEVELPNVMSVSDDRSLDTDAGECTIVMANIAMDPNLSGQQVELGDRGRFTSDRGGMDAEARWGPLNRDWEGVIEEGALVRVYQGFGGLSKTIGQAVADGNLILDGTYLIDSVTVNSAGNLELHCRDMAILLIEQKCYPPLIPAAQYPMSRCRWIEEAIHSPAIPEYDRDTPTHWGPEGFPKWIGDIALNTKGTGYWLVGTDGGVFSFGYASFYGGRGDAGDLDNAPMVGLDVHPGGRGYALVAEDGGVFLFGDVADYGSATGYTSTARRIRWTPTGLGYWILAEDGGVFTFGDAGYFGAGVDEATTQPFVDMRPTPSGAGYWLLTNDGGVYSYGDAVFHGAADGDLALPLEQAVGLAPTPLGDGYWVAANTGRVFAKGAAPTVAGDPTWETRRQNLDDLIIAIDATPSGAGYVLAGSDGGIFSFGDAPFYGSLPEAFTTQIRTDGNYLELSEIVRDLLLWSGFLLHGTGQPDVFGSIESTGTYAEACFDASFFDKKPVIDPINAIKEMVGYCHDETTEIFTRRGWLSHDQLRDGDFTLAIDPDTGESEWKQVVHVYRKFDRGVMYAIEGRDHSSLTTANHRWLTFEARGNPEHARREVRWHTTDTLNRRCAVPTAARCTDLPKEPVYSDDLVELVAWWWTEGSLAGAGGIISQSETANPEYTERIDGLLRRLYGDPGKLRRGKRTFDRATLDAALEMVAGGVSASAAAKAHGIAPSTLLAWVKEPPASAAWALWQRYPADANGGVGFRFGPEVAADLFPLAPAKTAAAQDPERRQHVPKVPTREFLLNLTEHQLQLFIDVSVAADGHHHRRDNERQQDPRSFWQKDPDAVAAFEFACALAGVATRTDWLPYRDIHRVGLHNTTHTKPIDAAYVSGRPGRVPTHYEGVIWCPTIEDHGNFLARRKGRVFYSGNCLWADYDGSIHFEDPNWRQPGNLLEDGHRTQFIPVIDENHQILSIESTRQLRYDRSEIIISTDEPTAGFADTVTTRYTPPQPNGLRGMVRNAMWTDQHFTTAEEQATMASLIAMHYYFAKRQTTVECVANPAIGINDQVWVYEKTTGESAVKYVRGRSKTHDLVSGDFTMRLTLSQLGYWPNWWIEP